MSKSDTHAATHRLQGFSDAVFAFACTLLIVSIEPPKNYAELMTDLSGFPAFGLAFAMLILVWSVHHKLFQRFPLDDAWAVCLNAGLLFTVLLFVYPLKFLAVAIVGATLGLDGHIDQGVHNLAQVGRLFVVYGCAFAVIFGLTAALYFHASRHARASGSSANVRLALGHMRHYLVYVAIALVSVLLSLGGIGLEYGLPGWIYFLLGPAAWINGVLVSRYARGSNKGKS